MVSEVKVSQLCLTLCDCTDYTVHRILQARILEWVGFPFSMDLPKPEIEPRSPALQVDSLPSEPWRKPKNNGVGSLSLLQQISWSRNRTGVFCIAGGFFTSWATREASKSPIIRSSNFLRLDRILEFYAKSPNFKMLAMNS